MSVLQLLASENFITYNKVVAKKFGVNVAILLGALCSYQSAFQDEEFYKEQDKISDDTCLSKYEIQQALKVLQDNEIVKVEKKGLPAKNYYFIFDYKLLKLFSTSGQNFRPLEVEKLDDYIYNKNNIDNNNNKKDNKKNYKNEILTVVEYLNGKAGTSYKTSTPKTITLITARLNEGFTTQDFIAVIDKKVEEWKNTNMERYLRPETLFGTKFEGYLNEKTTTQKSNEQVWETTYGVRL